MPLLTRIVLNNLAELKRPVPIGLQGFAVKLPVEENFRRSMSAWQKLTK